MPFDISRQAAEVLRRSKMLADLPMRQKGKFTRKAVTVEHANVLVAFDGDDDTEVEAYLSEVYQDPFGHEFVPPSSVQSSHQGKGILYVIGGDSGDQVG